MLEQLKPIAQSFRLGSGFIERLTGDFQPADWRVKDAAGHDARWILGHLATYRHRALALMGRPVPEAAWEAHFMRGTQPGDVPGDLPVAEVLAAFHAATPALDAGWEDLDPGVLARPTGRAVPGGDDSVGDVLRFLAFHEAYHLGQIGLLRRLAGRAGIA